MKRNGKLFLALFLIIWTVFSFVLLVWNGHAYIGKSFFESNDFKIQVEQYKEQLGHYILEPFDAEEAKKNITVSQDEIEYHRNYYGTLTDQIENIRTQYSERIATLEGETTTEEQVEQSSTGDQVQEQTTSAPSTESNSEVQGTANDNESIEALLIKERDAKIADITENFMNDEHVEAKIRKQKEELIDKYAAQQARYKKDFLNEYNYFVYNFTNIETGEKFESGDVKSSDVYSEKFGNQEPYYKVDSSTNIEPYEYSGEGDDFLINSLYVEGTVSQFEGAISIPKSMLNATDFKDSYTNFTVSKMIFFIIWATGLLTLIGLFTFAKPSFELFTRSNRVKEIFSKWPVDVRIVFALVVLGIGFIIMDGFVNNTIQHIVYYYSWNNFIPNIIDFLTPFIFMIVTLGVGTLGVCWIWESIVIEGKFKQEIKNAWLYRLADGMQDLFLNRSIGIQSLTVLIIAFLTGIGFIGAVVQAAELVIVFMLLFFFIALPSFIIYLRRIGYLNRIMKQTKDIAEGRLTSEVKVKGRSPFAKHAANVNALREGVKKSMSEQAKSERLKTELITNVSHDLRTPLTSIITYTDLLKNPNITEEERKQYIDVLDKKSARLKTLIEDLFEVSKMASGNIEISKQRIDLTQLMQQAIGEHREAFANTHLDLRATMPGQPLFAYIDGQKMWRVVDNLIVNALKYSLEGTRVYVTLKQLGTEVELVVKNVSKYELNDNVEELTERFKRADTSRHTDGSGLGLAIAQSIVDLHNGRLNIEVDGDLFKVTVTVPIEE